MEPENDGLQRESPFPGANVQVLCCTCEPKQRLPGVPIAIHFLLYNETKQNKGGIIKFIKQIYDTVPLIYLEMWIFL